MAKAKTGEILDQFVEYGYGVSIQPGNPDTVEVKVFTGDNGRGRMVVSCVGSSVDRVLYQCYRMVLGKRR